MFWIELYCKIKVIMMFIGFTGIVLIICLYIYFLNKTN